MARKTNRLSARSVATIKDPGYYADGNGLYLQVIPSGARTWIFRFSLNKRAREMGLGSLSLVSLGEAREKALAARHLLARGIDPIEAREPSRKAGLTFDQCAEEYVKDQSKAWKNEKHVAQWSNTLKTYASPVFGSKPVEDVTTEDVLRTLKPIWGSKTETASRVRGRIESVLGWAGAMRYRTGDNPAQWKGHLDKLLPAPSKVAKKQHHPALPFKEVRTFVKALRAQNGEAAKALEFTILTAARTGEAIGARFEEFDLKAGVWTVPAERMKSKRAHEVPLSKRAVAIVKQQAKYYADSGPYVFPGIKAGAPLSNMSMLAVLKRMDRGDLTAHGFRSTFRDWVGEATDYPGEMAEMALAHVVSDKTEAAYRRGTMRDKRRGMMEAWSKYVG